MDVFLDAFWIHFRCLFVAKRISGAHLVPLWAPTEALFASLMPSGIRKGSLLALGSLFAPSWFPFAALGVFFRGRVAPICSPSTWVHCPLSGVFLLTI